MFIIWNIPEQKYFVDIKHVTADSPDRSDSVTELAYSMLKWFMPQTGITIEEENILVYLSVDIFVAKIMYFVHKKHIAYVNAAVTRVPCEVCSYNCSHLAVLYTWTTITIFITLTFRLDVLIIWIINPFWCINPCPAELFISIFIHLKVELCKTQWPWPAMLSLCNIIQWTMGEARGTYTTFFHRVAIQKGFRWRH